jgi:hypothetical protein
MRVAGVLQRRPIKQIKKRLKNINKIKKRKDQSYNELLKKLTLTN